jgi:hypothetical protein
MFLRQILMSQSSAVVTPEPPPPASTLRNTLGLNGSSEYATIAADASVTFGTGNRSFLAWVEVTGTSQHIFQHGLSSGAAFIDLYLDGNSKITARVFDNAASFTNQRNYSTTAALSTTGVHLVGVTFNDWGAFEFYVDGVLSASSANSTGSPGDLTTTSTFELGRRGNGTEYLNGSVGACYLFDKNASAAEHLAVYNDGVGIQPADFSGHSVAAVAALYSNMMFGIPFNDGEANEEEDGSANTNDATLAGSPVYDGTQQLFED